MRSFFRSFRYAFRGIALSFFSQRNIKIQLAAGIVVIAWSLLVRLPAMEFCIILIVCFLVVLLEMLNTAMEKLIDLISPRYHRRFGEIKDIFAGITLLAACLSVILGVLILWKPSLGFLAGLFSR